MGRKRSGLECRQQATTATFSFPRLGPRLCLGRNGNAARPLRPRTRPVRESSVPWLSLLRAARFSKPSRAIRCLAGIPGVVLHAPALAAPLLYRADRKDLGAPGAADWLIRTLETRYTNGLFAVVIWGLSVDQPVEIANDMTLLPIDRLPDMPMKRRVTERAQKARYGAVWTSQNFLDAPGAAIVRKVVDFPYIGSPENSFGRLAKLESGVQAPLSFLKASAAGQPLVARSWFEYDDPDLDFNASKEAESVEAEKDETLAVLRRLHMEVGGRNKLAALLGVSGPHLGRVLRRERPMTAELIEKLVCAKPRLSSPIGILVTVVTVADDVERPRKS